MMLTVRDVQPEDGPRCIEIWSEAVDATHDFLSPEDRKAIGEEVEGFLPLAPLTVAVDENDRPVAFMLVAEGKLEALFVDPAVHRTGVGRLLAESAIASNPGLRVDVNEQNPGATAFYERLGFHVVGRSDHDDQGRPYPLLHLAHEGP